MRKYMFAMGLFAVLPMFDASAARRGGYTNVITNNFYYSQSGNVQSYSPSRKVSSGDVYRAEKVATSPVATKKKTARVEREYSSQMRKYFLANPFFQPLQGRVGSVTDFSYAHNNFNFDLMNGVSLNLDTSSPTIINQGFYDPVIGAKEQTSQFVVKEDISFGLTDTLAVIGMVQYDKTKVAFQDWTVDAPNDNYSGSGVNIFGIGLQNRFVDNEQWIATLAGYYQYQKDTANTFIGELKIGRKIDRTTIYGLGRIGYSSLIHGNAYGAYVENGAGDWMMLAYNTDSKNIMYAEGGMGVFAVLNKYFTLNGEMIYGHYDWHNQLSAKAAVGFQPADSFALNLYASASIYDSAKNKIKQYMQYDVNPEGYTGVNVVYTTGDYKIKDYNEWKIGVQAILYF